jgi:hypothetical protein
MAIGNKSKGSGEKPDIDATFNIFGDSTTCDPFDHCIRIEGEILHKEGNAQVRLGDFDPLTILDYDQQGMWLLVEFPYPMPPDGNYRLTVETANGFDVFEHPIPGPALNLSGCPCFDVDALTRHEETWGPFEPLPANGEPGVPSCNADPFGSDRCFQSIDQQSGLTITEASRAVECGTVGEDEVIRELIISAGPSSVDPFRRPFCLVNAVDYSDNTPSAALIETNPLSVQQLRSCNAVIRAWAELNDIPCQLP